MCPSLGMMVSSLVDSASSAGGSEHFEECFGLPAADGLRAFVVSDEIAPTWLANRAYEVLGRHRGGAAESRALLSACLSACYNGRPPAGPDRLGIREPGP